MKGRDWRADSPLSAALMGGQGLLVCSRGHQSVCACMVQGYRSCRFWHVEWEMRSHG